jgi:ribosomal protein L11
MLDVTHVKKCFLTAHAAEPVPPLGTILGNLGVNTVKFCEEFNVYSKNLPVYFLLKVIIYIFENRSFEFKVMFPSTGFILNLLKFEKTIKVFLFDRYHDKVIICVKLKDVIQLAKLKFPNSDLKQSVPIILGTVKSMNLIIEF